MSSSSHTGSSDPHAEDQLPPGWSRGFSKSQNRHFYFHSDTKHTQWHFPTASEAKDPTMAKRRAEMNQQQQQTPSKKRAVDSGGAGMGDNNSGVYSSQADSHPEKRPRNTPTAAVKDDFLALADATSVAIIVPYRDLHPAQQRAAHLRHFVPHMNKFLSQLRQEGKVSDFHIYIIEQSNDGLKFNRGKLLNIGFDLARHHKHKGSAKAHSHDVFIFHDVDLLPQANLGPWYAKFPKRPLHIARVWDRYSNNPKYFGGVVSFSSSDYRRINGYPNNYFGWGGEDDEMQRRLERLGIVFEAPSSGTLIDLEQMSLKEKLDFLRDNKEWKCMVKWELAEEHASTWKTNGLSDLKYTLLEATPLEGGGGNATKFTVDVKLNGDHWTNEKAALDFVG